MLKRLKSALAVSAVVPIFAAGAAWAEEVTLRWGHYLGDSQYLQVEKDFAAAVEEATDGRVKIEITFAGGLGAGPELLTLTGRQAIDMAAIVPAYHPEQLLFWRAYQSPFIFDSPRQALEISAAAAQDLPYFQEELDRFGVKFLFHQPLGSYYLTGPDASCTSIAALEGKKLRAFGADVPKIHQAIGAGPVSVSVGEIYEALQRGAIDYSFINRGNILAMRLYEPGTYSCGPVASIAGHLIVINQRVWDRISDEDQAAILELADQAGRDYIDLIDKIETEAEAAIVEAGGTVKPMPEAELAKWQEMAPDLLQAWIDDMDRRGMGDAAREVAEYWKTKKAE